MKVLKTSAIAIILAIALLLAPAAKSPASLELNGHEVTWVNHYASISLQIVPDKGLKIKEDTPLVVNIETSKNLVTSYPKIIATKENFIENVASFNINVKGKKKGQGMVTIHVTYFICSDVKCERFEDSVNHSIYVK